jgi:DNA-binding NarL/FixJ family response regulator
MVVQDLMMDERPAHRIVLLGAEAQLMLDVQTALQEHGAAPRFVIMSRPDPQGLDPGECELLLIDVDGQVERRLELLVRCRRFYPHLPALVLVRHGDTSAAVAAMKAGAADCLEKPPVPDRLRSAVMALLDNEPGPRPRVYRALTGTETQVLQLLLAGKTNLEIAQQFHRSRRTIEAHRRNIMRKLGAAHVSDLVKQAVRMNYVWSTPVHPAPPLLGANTVVCRNAPMPGGT